MYRWFVGVGSAVGLCLATAHAQTVKPALQPSLPHQVSAAFPLENNPKRQPASLDEIYGDESHCSLGTEVTSNRSSPGSCYCRDAIADARYVHFTYLLPAKDRNLNGVFLSLERLVRQQCGEGYDASGAIRDRNWKWSGPDRRVPPVKE